MRATATQRRTGAVLRELPLRILEALAQPGSAASLARRLGTPRQNIAYHLRALEREGLVELVEERRRGNCTERVVRATARAYLVGAEALGKLATEPAAVQDKLSSTYLVVVAAQAVREVAALRQQADAARRAIATLTLQTDIRFASSADRAAFAKELTGLVTALAAKYHDQRAPGGRPYRFFLGAYPAPRDKGNDHG